MPLFRRQPQPDTTTPVEEPDSAIERYEVMQCAGCTRRTPPFVYMSNGRDYCVPCARQVALVMRVYPAGKRDDDITNLDS